MRFLVNFSPPFCCVFAKITWYFSVNFRSRPKNFFAKFRYINFFHFCDGNQTKLTLSEKNSKTKLLKAYWACPAKKSWFRPNLPSTAELDYKPGLPTRSRRATFGPRSCFCVTCKVLCEVDSLMERLIILWQTKRRSKPKPSVWFSRNQFGFAAKTFFCVFFFIFTYFWGQIPIILAKIAPICGEDLFFWSSPTLGDRFPKYWPKWAPI